MFFFFSFHFSFCFPLANLFTYKVCNFHFLYKVIKIHFLFKRKIINQMQGFLWVAFAYFPRGSYVTSNTNAMLIGRHIYFFAAWLWCHMHNICNVFYNRIYVGFFATIYDTVISYCLIKTLLWRSKWAKGCCLPN